MNDHEFEQVDFNSGQTIPEKWQLFDPANSAPVSDPSSFVNFIPYQVSCTTLAG